jgi:hypothetical protein
LKAQLDIWRGRLVLIFSIGTSFSKSCDCIEINVGEYRRGNKKCTIQRNWHHRVYKIKENKIKTQHNMCWTLNKDVSPPTNNWR